MYLSPESHHTNSNRQFNNLCYNGSLNLKAVLFSCYGIYVDK